MNAIETRELTRSDGRQAALHNVSLTVPTGAVFGIVGPDGAGKTTLLHILATLTRPSSGDALILGTSVTAQPQRVRRLVGYMPDIFGSYTLC